jgi:hypothetical protein
MLLSFRVANHGSLREPQELNLVPVYADERPALTVAAIFGANASGKSTVLDAYRFFILAVKESQARWLPDAPIPRRPFLLDRESRTQPSTYAVDLVLDGVRYVYGFAVTDTAVTEEWLYAYPKGRRRVLFEREGMTLDYGSTLTGNRVQIERTLRPNSLYLSAAAQGAHGQLSAIWRHVATGFVIDDDTRQDLGRIGGMAVAITESFEAEGLPVRKAFLAAADLGVHGVRQGAERPVKRFDKPPGDGSSGPSDAFLQALLAAADHTVEFVHRVGDEEFVLPEDAESAGTRTWLQLTAFALSAVLAGVPLLVDEIDISLHPLLTARLLKLFQDPELNPKGAQLIFTTHSAALLGTMLGDEVLRRDQIWFTEKDPRTAASTLYPLSDFKPRKGENFERRYLAGSYGGVPVLPDVDHERIVKAMWEAQGGADVSA